MIMSDVKADQGCAEWRRANNIQVNSFYVPVAAHATVGVDSRGCHNLSEQEEMKEGNVSSLIWLHKEEK